MELHLVVVHLGVFHVLCERHRAGQILVSDAEEIGQVDVGNPVFMAGQIA